LSYHSSLGNLAIGSNLIIRSRCLAVERNLDSYRCRLPGSIYQVLWRDAVSSAVFIPGKNHYARRPAIRLLGFWVTRSLEYHTIVFVGFEDSAFWNFSKKPTEETCTFFVAFSRAKNRVVFTFCEHPAKPAHAPLEPQHRATVGPLYAILEQAGVSIEDITD
jgi:hypothetical protein